MQELQAGVPVHRALDHHECLKGLNGLVKPLFLLAFIKSKLLIQSLADPPCLKESRLTRI